MRLPPRGATIRAMRDYPDGTRRPSYAVLWRRPDGVICSGELQLRNDALRLAGICRDGSDCEYDLAYRDISTVRIGRLPRERIDGRSTLILETGGLRLQITGTVGLGVIHEMAEEIEALMARSPAL